MTGLLAGGSGPSVGVGQAGLPWRVRQQAHRDDQEPAPAKVKSAPANLKLLNEDEREREKELERERKRG